MWNFKLNLKSRNANLHQWFHGMEHIHHPSCSKLCICLQNSCMDILRSRTLNTAILDNNHWYRHFCLCHKVCCLAWICVPGSCIVNRHIVMILDIQFHQSISNVHGQEYRFHWDNKVLKSNSKFLFQNFYVCFWLTGSK